MVDFYEELNLDKSSDLATINKTLSQLENIWKRSAAMRQPQNMAFITSPII